MRRFAAAALVVVSCAGSGLVATGAFQAADAASICTAPAAHAALAAKVSRDIQAAMSGRTDMIAVTVADRRTGVVCRLNEGHRYDSASVVKVTILAALLRWHQETGKALTHTEISLATAMITQSDNNAASALWNEVGRTRLQHFLNLAKMTETILGPGGYWGLTQITGRDELTQLRLVPVHRGERAPSRVVDQLRGDAAVGAVHRHARALCRPHHLGAHAPAAFEAALLLGEHGHARACILEAFSTGRDAIRASSIEHSALMRACPPCAGRTRPRSGCPCPCTARVGAACG